jgi:hypothetical protein
MPGRSILLERDSVTKTSPSGPSARPRRTPDEEMFPVRIGTAQSHERDSSGSRGPEQGGRAVLAPEHVPERKANDAGVFDSSACLTPTPTHSGRRTHTGPHPGHRLPP